MQRLFALTWQINNRKRLYESLIGTFGRIKHKEITDINQAKEGPVESIAAQIRNRLIHIALSINVENLKFRREESRSVLMLAAI